MHGVAEVFAFGPSMVPIFSSASALSQVYIIFVTICVITLAAALDATSISVALPIMAEKLRSSAIEAFWAGTSFLLCSTVFQPTFASLSNIFGRKPLIMIAIVLFTVGSIIPAVANNFTVILVGRSIQGVGGGGIITLTEILVTDLVNMGFMWALGSVVGPVLGGGFAHHVTWRWIFYINLAFCAISLVLVPIFLRLNQKMESVREKLARVDWIGAIVFISSNTAVLIPISWGGIMYPWDHWRTFVPLILGFAGLALFIVWEIHFASEPLTTLNVFMNRTAAVSYINTVLHGIIYSPIKAGIAIFPQTFTVAPASVVVGIIVSITGRFRWAFWLGWVLTTAGMGLMYLLDVHTPTVRWIFIDLVAGLGTGMLFPSMAFAIQASASNEDTAIAVAMFSFLRAFGQSFGVAIGGIIFQNALVREFGKHEVLKGLGTQDAVALVQLIKALPHGLLRQTLVQTYADALKILWATMTTFAGVGLFVSMGTKGLSLDRALVTDQGIREEKAEVGKA
ncbi:major facilitator superfamily domain-containing protein [Pyronema domesticum]|nr:major facilitator superfamily domain-containing protein [Pyronema domesticum]